MKRKKPQGSLSQNVYDRLQQEILRGQLPMGTPLSRRALAGEFSVSLLPVSEALQRLESDGLVESRPRVGTRVRVPTAQDIRGHYVVREALETQSSRLFSEKASPEERRELMQMAAALDQLNERAAKLEGEAQRDTLYEQHRLHMQFHMRVAECGGCPALCEAIEKNHLLLLNWHYSSASGIDRLPPRWHRSLAEALCNGTAAQADRAMRKHVRFGMDEVLRNLQAAGGTPDPASQTFRRTKKSGRILVQAGGR